MNVLGGIPRPRGEIAVKLKVSPPRAAYTRLRESERAQQRNNSSFRNNEYHLQNFTFDSLLRARERTSRRQRTRRGLLRNTKSRLMRCADAPS